MRVFAVISLKIWATLYYPGARNDLFLPHMQTFARADFNKKKDYT